MDKAGCLAQQKAMRPGPDTEADGHTSATIITIAGHLAPLLAARVLRRARQERGSPESSRGPFRAEAVHAWTASSAAERRWCRQSRSIGGRTLGAPWPVPVSVEAFSRVV